MESTVEEVVIVNYVIITIKGNKIEDVFIYNLLYSGLDFVTWKITIEL